MKRPRLRRAFRWAGTSILVLLVIGAVGIELRPFAVSIFGIDIIAESGTFHVWWNRSARAEITGAVDEIKKQIHDIELLIAVIESSFPDRLFPRVFHRASITGINVPLWIPFLAVAGPTGWLWLRDRRRAPDICYCGYNLTGNTSDRCPECGSIVEHVA